MAFSTSELFAIEVDEMATDPELEEAAIRFANGDDAGAESSLLRLYADRGMASRSISHAWAGVRSARWGHPNRKESR